MASFNLKGGICLHCILLMYIAPPSVDSVIGLFHGRSLLLVSEAQSAAKAEHHDGI